MTRLGKLQKEEGQRRSPRVCALEASCMRPNLDNNGQGPASRTRGTKKKRLRPLQHVSASASPSTSASPNQGAKHSSHQNVQKRSAIDQPSQLPSSTLLPEKRILEHVLDTLQRKDAYEIFAEPVDPNEVEDYYTVIKEPMDFATMRAKLHEGMYKTLEQFEHDMFLIFNNAMNFNSAGTIYFRQARYISEAAKKVFDELKTNPEKFEMENSETRRKVARRNQGDFRDSTGMKFNERVVDEPSKNAPCSSRGTSNRKSVKANHESSDSTKRFDARDVKVSTGTKDNSRCRTSGTKDNSCRTLEVDRRCTYKPLSLEEDESIFSTTVYDKLKRLEHVNQQDIGYKDSLMMFVKGLGPTAQNIAKRKLLGCEIHTASTDSPLKKPNPFSIGTTSTLMSQYPNEMRAHSEKIDIKIASGGEKVQGTFNAEREKGFSPLESNAQGNQRWSFGCNKVFPNQRFCPDSHYPGYDNKAGMMMLLEKSKTVNQENLSGSILENSQTKGLESRLENNYNFQSSSRPWHLESGGVSCLVQDRNQLMQKSSSMCVPGDGQNIEAHCPTNEVGCTFQAVRSSKSEQTVPLASNFVFNLPYLKTRLDQINSSEQHRFSQQDSSGGKNRPFSAPMRYHQGFLIHDPSSDMQTTLYSHNLQKF